MGFLDNTGIFLGAAPARPQTGQDLGEYGSSGRSGRGFAPGSGSQVTPGDVTIGNYWARSNGVLFPATLGNAVAINQVGGSYGAKLSVNGNIAAVGYLLSDAVYITKDISGNMIFTDVISGSHTLTELLSTGGGDVMISGTPVVDQLAQWVSGVAIKGLDISALVLAMSQITGLTSALAGKASLVHNLVDTTNHPVAGLTPGNVLTAITPTSYAFAAPTGSASLWKEVTGILSPLTDPYGVHITATAYATITAPDNISLVSTQIYLQSPIIMTTTQDSIITGGTGVVTRGFHLNIQGGDATAGNNDGGHLLLSGGSAYGSGVTGIVQLYGFQVQVQADDWISWQSPSGIDCVAPLLRLGYMGAGTITSATAFEANGNDLILEAGYPHSDVGGNYSGGDLHLNGGIKIGSGVTGKIFISTGSAGANPLAGSGTGTSILLYNRTTGEITFGDK